MGGGASVPMHRLRKALLIRAYNARPELDTIRDQFCRYKRVDDRGGHAYIAMGDVKKALKVDSDSPWMDNLLSRSGLDGVTEIDYESFIAFLETGSQPVARKCSQGACLPPPAPLTSSSCPMPAGSRDEAGIETSTCRTQTSPADKNEATPPTRRAEAVVGALVLHKGTTLGWHGVDGVRRPKPKHPLWRKRETLIQERIVEYTTIDLDGTVQELVEREKSQTEVLHMECKETGEFAHRETTEYEQSETFNAEVVVEEHGSEEYVHLKSRDDEYEFMESTMPRKHAPPPPTHTDTDGHPDPPNPQDMGEAGDGGDYPPTRMDDDEGTVAPGGEGELGMGEGMTEEEEEEYAYWMAQQRHMREQRAMQGQQMEGEEEECYDGPVFIDNDERMAMPPTPDLPHEEAQGPEDVQGDKQEGPWTPVRQGRDKDRGLAQSQYATAVGEVQDEDEWMRPPPME